MTDGSVLYPQSMMIPWRAAEISRQLGTINVLV